MLSLFSVLLENTHVDELVLFRCVKLHAVPVAEVALHFVKRRVHQDFLQVAYNFVELVVTFVLVAAVHDLKQLFVFPAETELLGPFQFK